MGHRITLQDWRHIAIAISKKHARQEGDEASAFEKADDDDDDNDGEHYEIPDDLAASHTSRTATRYGVTIDVLKRLTAESLEVFGQVSRRWHRFLQLLEPLPAANLLRAPPTPPSIKRRRITAKQEETAARRPRVQIGRASCGKECPV